MWAGMSRRGFLSGLAAGAVGGGAAGWFAYRSLLRGPRFSGRSSEQPRAPLAMPGPFPGRVVEVRHPAVVSPNNVIQAGPVRDMVANGMSGLIGGNADAADAWRRFFSKDDVVGIKVNPVGRRPLAGEAGRVANAVESISSPALITEVVRSLKTYVGMPPANIILFERYAREFHESGYDRLMTTRELEGCRWLASSYDYDDQQLAIDGQKPGERHPNVVGYDPDVFVTMPYASPAHDLRDERRARSHLSMIVSRMVNKFINLPCLKDHRSAGVTIALKNMSHGMNNNVARSHIGQVYRLGGQRSGPNQCNTFIPAAINQRPLMEKATLHICDGLIGVYEGGPGNWNRTWGTWARKSLFFATDPVAMDHVGWDIIDRKRAEVGWAPVGAMGQTQGRPMFAYSPNTAAMSLATSGSALMIGLENARLTRLAVEQFDRRQPEHVALAGLLGLGRFDPHLIDHRVIELRRA